MTPPIRSRNQVRVWAERGEGILSRKRYPMQEIIGGLLETEVLLPKGAEIGQDDSPVGHH